MDIQSAPIKTYRIVVFALALFYVAYFLTTKSFVDNPGGPLRYLTIWALFCSAFVALRLLLLSLGKSDQRWDGFVGMTAVLNAMVVFLYWKLFFADPKSVTSDGELGVWWLEFYLHLVGPALQWIDALVFHKAFRKFRASLVWLVGIIIAYVAWAELFVGPMNAKPIGSVTTGLPYPFLNNLTFDDRMVFYIGNVVVSFVFLCGFFAICWVLSRLGRAKQP